VNVASKGAWFRGGNCSYADALCHVSRTIARWILSVINWPRSSVEARGFSVRVIGVRSRTTIVNNAHQFRRSLKAFVFRYTSWTSATKVQV